MHASNTAALSVTSPLATQRGRTSRANGAQGAMARDVRAQVSLVRVADDAAARPVRLLLDNPDSGGHDWKTRSGGVDLGLVKKEANSEPARRLNSRLN
jgi:hypothetical protein